MDAIRLSLSLQRVIARYARTFAPARIILFGSHAKGSHGPESDVDLLVVTHTAVEGFEFLRHARQLARDCFPPIDIVFASTEEVEQATVASNPFLASILATGITVYPRAKGESSSVG